MNYLTDFARTPYLSRLIKNSGQINKKCKNFTTADQLDVNNAHAFLLQNPLVRSYKIFNLSIDTATAAVTRCK